MRFAPEARPFVAPFALAGVAAALSRRPRWAAASLALGAGVLLFFRIPDRAFEGGPRSAMAPADGLITGVDEVEDPEVGPGLFVRISTFLSVFDVHVQRAPLSGEVIDSRYTPGRKVAAFRGDAAEVNERHLIVIRREDGKRVGVRQVAGLVARRVVSYPRVGDRLERGQLIGLIKFGSRVDLLLPRGDLVRVAQGDRVATGRSVMAEPASR